MSDASDVSRAPRSSLDRCVALESSSAAWPVSVRNTSSSVGLRDGEVVDRDPGASSRRTASAIAPRRSPERQREPSRPRTRRLAAAQAGERRERRLGTARVGEPYLEPLAAELGPSARPAFPRRSACRGRSPRSGRRAGRPRRGTASSAAPSCPAATSPSIISQSADPAARVEPGRRLVEEEHRRTRDERRGQVEPAPHAARVRLARAGLPASARSKRRAARVRPLACGARPRW